MRILVINPVGTDVFDQDTRKILEAAKGPTTEIDVVSLAPDRPKHLEYHAYEALVMADIVKLTHEAADQYDGVVIGCFYDVGLREAREVSGRAVVTAPCQAATDIASHLGNTFSVLVTRKKCIPKMKENIRAYGHGDAMVSMRALGLGVHELQADHAVTRERLMTAGRGGDRRRRRGSAGARLHGGIRLLSKDAGAARRAGHRRNPRAPEVRRVSNRATRSIRLVRQPQMGQRSPAG